MTPADSQPLGDLDAIAEQRRRRQAAPPNRHGIPESLVGPRPTPVPVPAPEVRTESRLVAAQPVRAPNEPPSTGPEQRADSLAKYSIYIDARNDDFLETVRTAGRRGRVDASRSAVVRLALTMLGESLGPNEVAKELARRAPKTTTSGRKRL